MLVIPTSAPGASGGLLEWVRKAAGTVNQLVGKFAGGKLDSLRALDYSGNAAKAIVVNATEDGFELSAAGGGGTTTNALTINNGGAGAASGATFNGSAAVTISYNSIGAQAAGSYLTAGNNLSDVSNATTARANLGVAIGTNVQAWDADLDALAALSGTDTIYRRSGAATWSAVTFSGNLTFSGGALSVTGWRALGGAYTAAGVWDFSVDGAVANVDFTGLAGASDIRLIMDGVTKGITGVPLVTVSVNNGSAYFTSSGDYVFPDTAGSVSNATSMCQMHLTNATAARSAVCEIQNANKPLPVGLNVTVQASHRLFKASASPINAVRITPSGGGNFTGGKFYCLVR